MIEESQFGEGALAARSDRYVSPSLVISIFGGIGLRVRGRELALPNRKARALLAYLAFENNSATRERVAGLLLVGLGVAIWFNWLLIASSWFTIGVR